MSRSWIVGGALRDELLGREVTDIDIAVEENPEDAARELAAELRGPVFQLSEAFGAWRVVDRRGGRVYDFARLQGDTIEEDLVTALVRLYCYLYQADPTDVRRAAELRAQAMALSDAWVDAGCQLDDPTLAQERLTLVASYSALREASDRGALTLGERR